MSKKALPLCLMALFISSCGKQTVTKTKVMQVPRVETLQVPVTVPGTSSIISVPQIIVIDKGFGIKTFPKPISEASEAIKGYSKAVAKVMRIDGSSGTGFFISEDGLFITNEHVVPSHSCKTDSCPGTKLVRDFRYGGDNEVFASFDVLAHSDSDGELDFTLLKVRLKDGDKVPYLPIELDKAGYDFGESNKRTYKVIGHPGGASLRFTNAKPIKQNRFNIELLGLLIPGNSGGPLIDEETGKVIGLVKATRTAFIKEDAESSSHQTRARASSMLDVLRNLKAQNLVPEVIAKLNSEGQELEELEKSDSQEIIKPAESFSKPSKSIFLSALRKESNDYSFMKAVESIDKYIGTSLETDVLNMMFEKSELVNGELNIRTLSLLMKKQIQLGRALKLSESNIQAINAEILNGDDITNEKLTFAIYYNYYNEDERNKFQEKCRSAIPQFALAYLAMVNLCVTTTKSDNSSLIPAIVENLKQETYQDVDDFGMANVFAMLLGIPGVKDEKDKSELVDLARFLEERNKDIESIVQSDSFLMDAVLGARGAGSFKATFPKN